MSVHTIQGSETPKCCGLCVVIMTSTALSVRQNRFVLSYCGHLNASRACRESGYAATGGADSVTACRLLRNDKVKAAIQALQQAKAEEMELTRQHVINEVLGAIQTAREQRDASIMLRGWITVARMTGLDKPEPAQQQLDDDKDDMRCVSTAELLQTIAGKGQYRNADGSSMTLAQIDDFYAGLADAEIMALAEGRAMVETRVVMLEGVGGQPAAL